MQQKCRFETKKVFYFIKQRGNIKTEIVNKSAKHGIIV